MTFDKPRAVAYSNGAFRVRVTGWNGNAEARWAGTTQDSLWRAFNALRNVINKTNPSYLHVFDSQWPNFLSAKTARPAGMNTGNMQP